ncbi:MAG: hypothetical protein WD382_02160 [Halofilum sp. (in: g-proteobacteria)]
MEARFQAAREKAKRAGKLQRFDEFVEVVEKSSVTVAVPAQFGLSLVTNEATQFVNYEKLVGAGVRAPAGLQDDSKRRAVAGALFPSFGEKISYGVLAIANRGLPSYGDIYFRLKPKAIAHRCTFLERNSFDFLEQNGGGEWPLGYMSDWNSRSRLASAKLVDEIIAGKGVDDWDEILVQSDGRRENDDFIEAHVFGTFNLHSIEDVRPAEGTSDVRTKQLVELTLAAFEAETG